MSIEAPIKPSKTPKICVFVDAILKTANPIKIAFRGTNAFRILTTPLSTSVSANANKKLGKKVPKKPDKTTHFH